MKPLPRYPVYIPSKGRADVGLTTKFLDRDDVPYRIVVEPQEVDEYARAHGEGKILELPFRDLGQGSIPARNWIWEHALASDSGRHWVLDDNITEFRWLWKGRRIPCDSGLALVAVEDFADRYENVAVAGHNYQKFVTAETAKAFHLNCHVYSSLLILNELPHRWRGRYNEDTDLCLHVLADGWCTVLTNVFMANKATTMTIDWKKFDTPLKRRADVDFDALPATNEYGARLRATRKVESEKLRELQARWER